MHLTITAVKGGKPIEVKETVPEIPAVAGKEKNMWIFDGEEWFEEGSEGETRPSSAPKPEKSIPREEFLPELQVIEIPITIPRTDYIPPFPLP